MKKQEAVIYTEPAAELWFLAEYGIPRDVDTEADFVCIGVSGSATGFSYLIECSDGSVFRCDDVMGKEHL